MLNIISCPGSGNSSPVRYHYTYTKTAVITKPMAASVPRSWRNGPPSGLVGVGNGAAILENSLAFP